ncbi:MAG TPA: T9SS type A sorting domain-containing protein [Bacteroidales bacterium]|nr:T9SS type A sorting domain-containing protein [Bacteroidales bacterium]
MKRILLIVMAISATLSSYGQFDLNGTEHRKRDKYSDCTDRVQRLDKVKGFVFDAALNELLPSYVFNYSYQDSPLATEVIRLVLPSGETTSRQIYEYDDEGLKTSYLYQLWVDNAWSDFMLTQYEYNSDGLLITEMFSRLDQSGQWAQYQRHLYEYDQSGHLTFYLRQMNYNNIWTDFSRVHYIRTGNLVTERYEVRVADNTVIWEELYVYDNEGILTERFRQDLKYDALTNTFNMINTEHRKFYYDIYGDLAYVDVDTWGDGKWNYAGRVVYFYTLNTGKKVCLCHNGITIRVSVNAVAAHLRHGDKLGVCEEDRRDLKKGKTNEESYTSSVYPNPVKGCLDLRISSADHPYKYAMLYNRAGSLLMVDEISRKTDISMNLEKLISGEYYLKLTGDPDHEKTHIIIKRN